ncbi:MAG: Ribosomal protein methylthiotransferase accessory factor [Actinomycetia bacterium]|nr:Ribosomal protein methylthiotransferase accessory factor [Actinomycetes bacterium]
MTTAIRHRAGTYRAVSPAATWSMISPKLNIFGITRVAEVTGLDEIGIPVFVAYRPDSKTVTVSIGTGLDPMQARVSAAMESVEVWHVENVEREPEFRGTAAHVRPPYDLRALNISPHSPLTEHCVLDWVTGTGLLTGRPVPVPLETLPIDFTGRLPWSDALFRPTTNGVASGNTPADAILHGLHEVAERECIAEYLTTDPAELRYCDIEEENSEYIQQIVARLRDAGCAITLIDITNRLGIPCYASLVWSPDVPYRCGGFGCHVDPEIAAGRALLEAAQSRLAAVSGARDDIDADNYLAKEQGTGFPDPTEVPSVSLRRGPFTGEPDLESVVRSCAGRIKEVTGFEPFTVDLAHNDIGIPVQKSYAPGVLMFDHEKFTASQQRA